MFQNSSIKFVGIALLIAAFSIPLALAENEVEKPEELKVGMIAPDFTLKDETGTKRSLSEFLGEKSVVLAFYPKDFTGG